MLGFELETYQVPLDQLLPSKKVSDGVMSTHKYKPIVSSINEVGRECPVFCVRLIGSMLHQRSKDNDDTERTAGRAAQGL